MWDHLGFGFAAKVKEMMPPLLCKLPLTVFLRHMRVSLAWTVLQGVSGMQESRGNTGIAEFCERQERAGSGGTRREVAGHGGKWRDMAGSGGTWREVAGDAGSGGKWRDMAGSGGTWREVAGHGRIFLLF